MKRFILSFLCLSLLTLQTLKPQGPEPCGEEGIRTTSVPSPIRSIIIPRNTGANTARELVGMQDFIHLCEVCGTYGVVAVELEYTQSFRATRIARQLFGVTGITSPTALVSLQSDAEFLLRFEGSKVPDRSPVSLVADNFGLSQTFDGALRIKPKISNVIADFEFYLGLDCWIPHLWFRTNLPVTHTRWTLFDISPDKCSDNIQIINPNSENNLFPPCYMGDESVTPASNILQALSGDFTFGDMQTPWKFGKFSSCALEETRLADIDLILGYDVICCENSHLGFFVQASCPTGNPPESEFIFEPIVGNGDHWGLGGGFTTHATIWQTDCDQFLSIWAVGTVQHLFRDSQIRSFDFKTQGPLSRYMLLKEFDSNGNYTGKLINGINFATRRVETKMQAMTDISVKIAYRNNGFVTDFGYNFWARSAEEVKLTTNPGGLPISNIQNNTFGFKGCEGVCYRQYDTTDVNGDGLSHITNPEIRNTLSNTSSNATAFSCGTVDNGVFITPPPISTGNPAALTWDSAQINNQPPTVDNTVVGPMDDDISPGVIFAQESRVNGALAPKLLTTDDINFLGARKSITNKLFGYVGYIWVECEKTPFIGIHGEVEFDIRKDGRIICNDEGSTSESVRDRSINQWGIGFKAGMSF